MPTPDQAFEAYLAMWNELDEERCRALAGEAITEDALILYPSVEAHGRAEAVAAAKRLHQDSPGVEIVLTSGVEHHHGWIRAAWRLTTVDGSVRQDGQTIVELAEDGRLCRAIGFLDPLPARP